LQGRRKWTAFEEENTKHSDVLSAYRNTQTHTHTYIRVRHSGMGTVGGMWSCKKAEQSLLKL